MFSLVAMAILDGDKPRGISGRNRKTQLSEQHHIYAAFNVQADELQSKKFCFNRAVFPRGGRVFRESNKAYLMALSIRLSEL